MTDEERLAEFVQDLYLTRYNRQLASTATSDTDYVDERNKVIRWANMFADEIEQETDSNGMPMNWNFMREDNRDLGEVLAAGTSFSLPAGVLRLVIDEDRPLTLEYDGAIIARFEVVDANQITRRNDVTGDRVSVVGSTLVFSRAFKDEEIGAHVVADVLNSIPRLTVTPAADASLITTIKPYQLLILGVCKNATLPDIVQGGLSPSFAQKYSDLLDQVKINNNASSTADTYVGDDYGYIGGIGF